MEVPQLTEEERAQILQQIEEREFLEKAAVEQEKAARKAESDRQHRESLAETARRAEEERAQRLENNLVTSINMIEAALNAFRKGDQRECYRLLVKCDPFLISTKNEMHQAPERPSVTGLPTVRVKAQNPLGFMLINLEDLSPSHEVLEDESGS